jgi:hypothetical protein
MIFWQFRGITGAKGDFLVAFAPFYYATNTHPIYLSVALRKTLILSISKLNLLLLNTV